MNEDKTLTFGADAVPPPIDRVGSSQEWTLPLDDFEDGETLTLEGRFLGMGTSRRAEHIGHPDTEYTVPGNSCSACRWFETRLFRAKDGRFLLFNVGETILPDEEPFYSYEWCHSPYEVIDLLTTIRTDDDGTRRTFLKRPASRLLAQAAYHDNTMKDAYEGRMSQL